MQDVLFVYEISPTTWAYLSALMLIGIFFQFYRVWSMRNVDLLTLIAVSPGILLIHYATASGLDKLVRLGFVWIAGFGIFFLLRLLLDPLLVRRPAVEPNLNRAGITFTGVALTLAMIASLFLPVPIARLEHLLATHELPSTEAPGLRAFHFLSEFTNRPDEFIRSEEEPESAQSTEIIPPVEFAPSSDSARMVDLFGSDESVMVELEPMKDTRERSPQETLSVRLESFEHPTSVRTDLPSNSAAAPPEESNPTADTDSAQDTSSTSNTEFTNNGDIALEPGSVTDMESTEAADPAEESDIAMERNIAEDTPVISDDPFGEHKREIRSQQQTSASRGAILDAARTDITNTGVKRSSSVDSPSTNGVDSADTFATNEIDPKTGWQKPSLPTQRFIARSLTIFSQMFLLLGIVLIGWLHFDSLSTGISAATFWLLLPYSSQMAGRLDHSIPGMLLLAALVFYRIPILSGGFIGLVSGFVFYPIFLLPLWVMFYLRRGLGRFLVGFTLGLLCVVVLAVCSVTETMGVVEMLRQMFGVTVFDSEYAFGLWGFYDVSYRLPIFSLCVVCIASLTLWPSRRNFGTLLSGTAMIMLSSQFWSLQEGGLFMAWYLPAFILTSFRPNLQDRIALTTVRPSRLN